MAHELTFTNHKAEMAYVGKTPWHGLGQRLTPDASFDTWLTEAGMGWSIKSAPCLYRPDGDVFIDALGRRVLYRSDTRAPLGVVSEAYKPVHPHEILGFFKGLSEAAGLHLETAGTLFGGKRLWALARLGEDTPIKAIEDKVGTFLLLATACDGSMATEARWTTVRVVCNNTLGLSRATGKAAVRVGHRQTFQADEVKQALGLVEAKAQFEEQLALFRELAQVSLTTEQQRELTLELLAPQSRALLTEDEATKLEATKSYRRVMGLAQAGQGQGLCRGTAWAWLNGVTEWQDHHTSAKSPSHRLNSAWFSYGEATKAKALKIAAELVA